MENKHVLLVDLSAIFRSAWHANGGDDQSPTVAFEATIGGVNRAVGMVPGASVAICLDGKGNWRKEIYPEYKAQREKQPEAMYGVLDRAVERLRADGHLIWKADGFEADDIIASACDHFWGLSGIPVTIASHDKDLLQLLRPNGIDFLKTSTWELIQLADDTTLLPKFGVKPNQLRDWLSLVGDKSDNVEGCDGIGDVKATKFLTKFGSLEGLYAAVDACVITQMDPFWKSYMAAHKSLKDNRPKVEAARAVIALRYDVDLKFDEVFEERKQLPISKSSMKMDDAESLVNRVFGAGVKVVEKAAPSQREINLARVDKIIAAQPSLSRPPDTLAPITQEERTPDEHTTVEESTEKSQTDVAVFKDAVESETALAVVDAVPFAMQLEPSKPSQLVQLATILFESKMYKKLASPEAILAIILRGREMGLPAGVSLDVFAPVEGRICPGAHYIINKAMEDPNCEYFELIESTSDSATYETKHRKNKTPTRLTYTLEQAKLAGLVKKDSAWEKRPDSQCRKTCGVHLARIVYPGAALGLYAIEEME